MKFTKYIYNNHYEYVSAIDFDNAIRTDSDIKKLCRSDKANHVKYKRQLPHYRFISCIEDSDFIHTSASHIRLPNEMIDCGLVKLSGLVCFDIDHLCIKDVDTLKEWASTDKNINYLALSVRCNGCFILYNVGINNQLNYIFTYNTMINLQKVLSSVLNKQVLIDPISLSPMTSRTESYDANPYCNFNIG